MIPVSMLQGAGFTGAATGVNLARDIEHRAVRPLPRLPRPALGPARRPRPLGGMRSLIPATRAADRRARIGAHFPGPLGLLLASSCVMGMAIVAACWGVDPGAAVQDPVGRAADAGGDAGADPLHDRLRAAGAPHRLAPTVAEINPVTQVVEAARQGFVGEVDLGGDLARRSSRLTGLHRSCWAPVRAAGR